MTPTSQARTHAGAEVLGLAAAAVAIPIVAWIGVVLAGRAPAFNDFHDYWLAGRLVANGRSPYDLVALKALAQTEGLRFVVGGGYSYPLPFAVAMVPLSLLPFRVALIVFNVSGLVLFGLTVAGWIRWAHPGVDGGLGRRRTLLAFAAGGFVPVFGSVAVGQANLLVVAVLAVGTVMALAGRPAPRRLAGGVAIGLAAIVKLVPGLLFVPFVLGRRFGAAAGLVAGALGSLVLAIVLAPAATAGSSGLAALLDADPYVTNQSINGLVSRLVRSSDRLAAPFPAAFDPRSLVVVATAVMALLTAAVLWRARDRLIDGRRGLALGLALALASGVVGAPKNSVWNESIDLVAVGLLLAVDLPDLRLGGLDWTETGLLAIWFASPAIWGATWLASPGPHLLEPIEWLAYSAPVAGSLALWFLLGRRLSALTPASDPGVAIWERPTVDGQFDPA